METWEYFVPQIFHELRQDRDLEALSAEMWRLSVQRRGPAEQELAQLRAANAELRLYLAATLRVLLAKGLLNADEIRSAITTVAAEARNLGAAAVPIDPPAEGDWRTAPPPPHHSEGP